MILTYAEYLVELVLQPGVLPDPVGGEGEGAGAAEKPLGTPHQPVLTPFLVLSLVHTTHTRMQGCGSAYIF